MKNIFIVLLCMFSRISFAMDVASEKDVLKELSQKEKDRIKTSLDILFRSGQKHDEILHVLADSMAADIKDCKSCRLTTISTISRKLYFPLFVKFFIESIKEYVDTGESALLKSNFCSVLKWYQFTSIELDLLRFIIRNAIEKSLRAAGPVYVGIANEPFSFVREIQAYANNNDFQIETVPCTMLAWDKAIQLTFEYILGTAEQEQVQHIKSILSFTNYGMVFNDKEIPYKDASFTLVKETEIHLLQKTLVEDQNLTYKIHLRSKEETHSLLNLMDAVHKLYDKKIKDVNDSRAQYLFKLYVAAFQGPHTVMKKRVSQHSVKKNPLSCKLPIAGAGDGVKPTSPRDSVKQNRETVKKISPRIIKRPFAGEIVGKERSYSLGDNQDN